MFKFKWHLGLGSCLVFFAALATLHRQTSVLLADDPKPGAVALQCKGYVVPARQVTLIPNVAGQVAELVFEEGKSVKAGDILAKLDPIDFELSVRIAEAKLRLVEAGVAKAKEGPSRADVELALARVEIAKAQLEQARRRLDGTVVRAPFDGVILTKRADVGMRIDPHASRAVGSLCDLADPRAFQVEIWVAEADLARVATGQSCSVQLEAFPKKSYRGQVHRILPVADRAKGAVGIRIRLEIPDGDTALRPEMSALVTIMAAS
jgi:HlyD family secretion protein